jgi:hypothetical protein
VPSPCGRAFAVSPCSGGGGPSQVTFAVTCGSLVSRSPFVFWSTNAVTVSSPGAPPM